MAATDPQMQSFADTRIRVRAESFRAFLAAITDDKNSIGDEYARASSNSAWADNRADGPPHLLQAGNSANPDDFLNYNAVITTLIACANGTATLQNIADLPGQLAVWQRACVRSPGN